MTPRKGEFKKWPEKPLEKLTEDDFRKVLEEQGDDVIADAAGDANFTDLVEAAGRWLQNRMENDPESLPATFMVKLYLDGKKAIAAKAVEPDPSEVGTVSILDRIDALPAEHAAAILKGELARLDSLRDDYFKALERLEKNA